MGAVKEDQNGAITQLFTDVVSWIENIFRSPDFQTHKELQYALAKY